MWSLMGSSWHTYPSIYAIGHVALVRAGFLEGDVLVEEKIDGSQFSFGAFDVGGELTLRCRSKGAELQVLAPDKMFSLAVEEARTRFAHLRPGWTYRAEYLLKPKHNSLAYDRVPAGHLMLFDINDGEESYLTYDVKAAEAERLGLEVAPRLYEGLLTGPEQLREMLKTTSALGGQEIEGVVVKRYDLFGPDRKVLMGKFVSERYKEVHAADWKQRNPSAGDVVERLIQRYRTPARWAKAVQHLREAGRLEGSPRDIGSLFREVPEDLRRECGEEIREALFQWAWSRISRGASAGLAEWYKERLLEAQFNGIAAEEPPA